VAAESRISRGNRADMVQIVIPQLPAVADCHRAHASGVRGVAPDSGAWTRVSSRVGPVPLFSHQLLLWCIEDRVLSLGPLPGATAANIISYRSPRILSLPFCGR